MSSFVIRDNVLTAIKQIVKTHGLVGFATNQNLDYCILLGALSGCLLHYIFGIFSYIYQGVNRVLFRIFTSLSLKSQRDQCELTVRRVR